MKSLFTVLSILMVIGSSAAQADWGRPGPGGPGPGGPGPGGPGWDHGDHGGGFPGRGGPGWGNPGPGPGGPGWGRPVPPPMQFQTQFVNCESNGYALTYCAVNGFVVNAQVSNQRSFAACQLGSSFGYQGNQIWVKDGCRATFAVQIRR